MNIDTYVVKFNVKLKDGSIMLLFANVLKQITGSIQRSPLSQNDIWEFLKLIPSDKLADFVPHTRVTSTVDLLIGSDYFWDIVGGDKVMLPLGMYILPSRFGYIVTGRSPGTTKDLGGGSYCAMFTATELVQELSERRCHGYELQCSVNLSVAKNPDLERFWCLEVIGIKDPIGINDDDQALQTFCDNSQV